MVVPSSNTNIMSKLSFRARALDPSKPMPIYSEADVPDLPEYAANRAVPQMPTGMQKEEECEHHLQRAICTGLIIPTPEVTKVPECELSYPSNYKQPRQLIHMQPFTMEQEIPDYDMDTDDERWLQVQKPRLDLNILKFEEMMDRLEKSSGQTVITLAEAKALLKEDDELTIAVYDYWLNKRLKLQHPLISVVRTEHRTGIAANNPYIAFRRRTEKMQTRKNRKNDEFSYEKMLKLRRDLLRAVTLLELVKRREKCKREYLHLTVEVFEKRFQARDYNGAIVAEAVGSKTAVTPRPAFTPIFHNHNQSWADVAGPQTQATHQHHYKTTIRDEMLGRREKRQYKKRKHKSRAVEGLSSDEESSLGAPPIEPTPEPDQKDEGPYIFKRKKQVNYHYGGPLGKCSSRLEKGVEDQYFMTSLSNRRPVGFVRKRMGRGGRVILDRPGANDDFWRGLNYTIREPNMNGALTEDDSITNKKLGTEIVEYNKDWAQKQRVPHHSGYSDSITDIKSQIKSDIKSEMELEIKSDVENPLEPTNFNNLIAKGFNIDNKETVELSPSLPRSLYHFRPKTPPPGSDRPCQLLQPDSNFIEPFQMEIQHLLPLSDAVVDHSPFLTDEIDLQTRWLDKGPQGPIFEDYVYEEQKKKKVDSFTSSRVSIYDASGEIPQPEDDELMEVNDELDSTEEEEIETTDEDEAEIGVVEAAVDEDRVYSPRNGQMPKLGFEADVPTLGHRHTHSINKYANVSLVTTAQSVTIESANDILKLEEAQKTPQVINNSKPMEVT